MPRQFLYREKIISKEVEIGGAEAHHIIKVLRLREGSIIRLLDKSYSLYNAEVASLRKGKVRLKILNKICKKLSTYSHKLALSLLKAKNFELAIQKSTELGISVVIPFISERTVNTLNSMKIPHKIKRWQRIAEEASKQCGRLDVPQIRDVLTFSELVKNCEEKSKFILWELEEKISIRDIFKEGSFEDVIFTVGPEGGFTEEEIILAKGNGFIPIGLGSNMLRSETACLVFLSILKYEAGELQS